MTYSNKQSIQEEVSQFIKEHSLPFRTNCPICGRTNTFSAALIDGTILYNCFSASCGLRGRINYDRSLNDIRRDRIGSLTLSSFNAATRPTEFCIEDYWLNPLQNEKCLRFMKYWKLLDLYAKRKIILYYDPKQDRCVFILRDHKGGLKGATGRALTFPNNRKWHIYLRNDGCPFLCCRGEILSEAILVEDCISAATLANCGLDSIGLLGTSIPEATIQYLLGYSTLYIALDKDATTKAIKLQKQLAPCCNTKIIPISKDIKYFNNEELSELKKYCTEKKKENCDG